MSTPARGELEQDGASVRVSAHTQTHRCASSNQAQEFNLLVSGKQRSAGAVCSQVCCLLQVALRTASRQTHTQHHSQEKGRTVQLWIRSYDKAKESFTLWGLDPSCQVHHQLLLIKRSHIVCSNIGHVADLSFDPCCDSCAAMLCMLRFADSLLCMLG